MQSDIWQQIQEQTMPDKRALLGPPKYLLPGCTLPAFEPEAVRIESFPLESVVKSFQKPTIGLGRHESVNTMNKHQTTRRMIMGIDNMPTTDREQKCASVRTSKMTQKHESKRASCSK